MSHCPIVHCPYREWYYHWIYMSRCCVHSIQMLQIDYYYMWILSVGMFDGEFVEMFTYVFKLTDWDMRDGRWRVRWKCLMCLFAHMIGQLSKSQSFKTGLQENIVLLTADMVAFPNVFFSEFYSNFYSSPYATTSMFQYIIWFGISIHFFQNQNVHSKFFIHLMKSSM